MNNFHFNPNNNRSAHLLKQYEQATRQIEDKKKQLQRKNLQIEFYQDPAYVKNKHNSIPLAPSGYPNPTGNATSNKKYDNLADEIMNDLLSQNKSRKIDTRPQSANYPYEQPPMVKLAQNQMYNNMNNFNNQNANQFAANYNDNPPKYPNPQQPNTQQQQSFVPRQNNFIQQNKRELEKQKLQNPSSMDDNPFAPKGQPVKRSVEAIEQKPIINERQQQKLKLQQGQDENPFWGQNRNRSKERVVNNNNAINYQQYQNVRQKEKEKLQRQLHNNNDFDIYQRPTSPPQIPAQKDNQNISKKAAFQNRYSNPFVKDEQYIKQKRQEQQRQYRRALQQQKKIEEERKKMEKQMVKEQKYAFNAYEPGTDKRQGNYPSQQNQMPIKSPSLNVAKKVDPNGKPPVYNYEQISKKSTSSSDMEFMKMKANQLKDNFKKGRILHDEYTTQIKKLAEYYKVDYKQLIDRKMLGQGEEELSWINSNNTKDKKPENYRQDDRRNSTNQPQRTQLKPEPSIQRYNIVENEQSLERFPDSQTQLKNYEYSKQPSSPSKNALSEPFTSNLPQQPYYGQFIPNMMANPNPNFYTQNMSMNPLQYGLASTSFMQQMPTGDVDLMRKIFEEVKAMKNNFQKNIEKQKTQKMVLQETFVKFMAQNMMQNQFQMHQNPSQQSQKSQSQNPNFSPRPNKKQQNISSDALHLNLSEQSEEFIEKSLSGVVNKIPFYSNSVNRSNTSNNDPSFLGNTPQQNLKKKQANNKNGPLFQNQETIDQFFSKPYKCKKFKKFSIMVDVSQSEMAVPSVSNFLALKNGKDVVNKLFEEDLMMMKKLQRQKDLEKLRSRVDNQLSYGGQVSSSQQSSSTVPQTHPLNQKMQYGNPPNYANYADTFNKNSGQFVTQQNFSSEKSSSKGKEKQFEASNSKYEEYQNYSRSKDREVKSSHQQNHRTYKKEEQNVPSNAFLKRHISNNEEHLPDFADQSDIKVRSPVYYSPKLSSEILQQDEYQTAQKSIKQQTLQSQFYGDSVKSPPAKESTNKKYQMRKKDFAYEEQRESQKKAKSKSPVLQSNQQKSLPKRVPQSGIMNLIQQNNQALKKYTVSPKNLNDYSPEQVDIREYSSINSNPPKDQDLINYFSGNKNQSNSSKEGYRLPPLVANSDYLSNNSSSQKIAQLSDKFNSQKNDSRNIYGNEESLEQIQSQHEETVYQASSRRFQSSRNEKIRIQENSQEETVKSMKYSYTSSRRPPPSVNISQTVESVQESSTRMVRPPLNKKRSSSRKKQSSIVRTKFEKDSILQKPPSSQSQMNSMVDQDPDVVVGQEPLQFDSNVYDSEYEQSVSQKDLQRKIQQLQKEQKMKVSEPQIVVNSPVIITSKSTLFNDSSKLSGIGGGKLKSLEEARNLAKQCKKKSIVTSQNDQIFKYEQKMSQLESFLTKRDDSVIKETKEVKSIKLAIQKSPQPKKNIMNLLDDLQNQSTYKQDFESYREESQMAK